MLKKPCSKLEYTLAFAWQFQYSRKRPVENSHSFFNVSYTWYKSLFSTNLSRAKSRWKYSSYRASLNTKFSYSIYLNSLMPCIIKCAVGCFVQPNKITTTWIQITHQNWNDFSQMLAIRSWSNASNLQSTTVLYFFSLCKSSRTVKVQVL